ncbi:MAG: hypothetical protein U9N55_07685 [candidate division Zixibacteria bacterium]|nr:hypothetical protein [candidate division Zixibacteria bacterium]
MERINDYKSLDITEFHKQLEKFLSMILHYEEVQQMARIAEEVFCERTDSPCES